MTYSLPQECATSARSAERFVMTTAADHMFQEAEAINRYVQKAQQDAQGLDADARAKGAHDYALFHNMMVALQVGLRRGTWIWVSDDMANLAKHSAASLPAFVLKPEDLPWPEALIVSGAPLFEVKDAGTTGWCHGLSWMATSSGVAVCAISRPEAAPALRIPAMGTTWQYGHPLMEEGDDPCFETAHRTLAAIWVLLRQRLAVATPAQASRPARRRIGRAMPERSLDDVAVITLRRPAQDASEAPEHRSVEWNHRWLVDGHWRQQWYPSLDDHRPVWIAPYVKGPEDKPLVAKARVYSWER